jgi:hypothetical protein
MLITAEHPKDEPDVPIIENYKGIVQSSGFATPQLAFIRALKWRELSSESSLLKRHNHEMTWLNADILLNLI